MSAKVTVAHRWDDEQVTYVTVEVDTSYPDALSQARAEAVRGLRDTVADFDFVPDSEEE